MNKWCLLLQDLERSPYKVLHDLSDKICVPFVRGMSFSKIFVHCNEVFIELEMKRKETCISTMDRIMMNEAVTLA